MIKSKVEKALNEQINAEMYSFYVYLAMSNWLTDANWDGMAKWMKAQAQEEMTHAMKLFDYIHERGGHVALDAIKKPAAEWARTRDAEAKLELDGEEVKITARFRSAQRAHRIVP